jgi:uncharacterized protein YndB with AHSA1/START domain
MTVSNGSFVEERRVVNAAPDVVFTVVTTAADIIGWLSNEARCEARPGGLYELRWNTGYAVHGEVKTVEKPASFSVTWQGSAEPGPTTVSFMLAPVIGGTEVTVRQSGFGRGEKWKKGFAESRKGWARSLENLQHLVETGIDLREARRPMLGVNLGDPLDADRIVREGIDTTTGVYLSGVLDGLSAQSAGMRAGDVITSIDGVPVSSFAELVNALQGHIAGDHVDVSFVRGKEHKAVVLELKPRPMPEVPPDPKVLLATAMEAYDKARAGIVQAVAGASEEKAGRRPAEGEWSAKEVIAHLSVTERDYQYQLGEVLLGIEPLNTTGNPSAVPEKISAALAGAPTVAGLLNRLAEDQACTLALVAALRPEIVANIARYHRIGRTVLDAPEHIDEHVGQIKAALAAK